ncbi:acyl-CoA thioesterase [Mesorhizobium ciceri]|uniref:acyl-CoA thioesterase n=1 Tax=Mesorhizobium TaxID=68287 RepID=UPI001FD90F82|nr:thioesterase family protein [Mesorhizobium ciceri]
MNTHHADLFRQPKLIAGVVHPWHLDQFGHMNVRGYAPFFDDASFLFWHQLQLSQQKMIDELGVHSVTLRASTEFKAELKKGDCFSIVGCVQKVGNKSVTLQFSMVDQKSERLFAVYDTIEVFVEAEGGTSVTIPQPIRDRLLEFHKEAGVAGTI